MQELATNFLLRAGRVCSLAALACLGLAAAHAGEIKAKDWSGQCEGPGSCFVQTAGQGPRLLVGWNGAENSLRVGALLPPGVGANQPVTLWVDDDASVFLATNACTPTYCEAMVDASKTDAVIETMKNAGSGVLAYPEGGRLQVSPVSFEGFSKAHAAVIKGVR